MSELKFTLPELDAVCEAIDEQIDRFEEDGDPSYKPLLKALHSAAHKFDEWRTRLRNLPPDIST